MDDPAEKDNPEQGRENELNHGHQQTPLDQLPQTGHEETAKRRNDVTG